MRVLVTTFPAVGHVHPAIPLAQELVAAGHELQWATGQDGCALVRDAGLPALAAGWEAPQARIEYFRRHPEARELMPEQLPAHMFPYLFGEIAAAKMLPDLLAIVEAWLPDIVVHVAGELAGPIAAARIGVPNVCQGYGALVQPERVAAAAELVAPLWRLVGLEPRPWAGCYDHLYLDIYPPSLRPSYGAHVLHRASMRPVPFSVDLSNDAEPIGTLEGEGPLVYLTFGTVFNASDGPFGVALDGLATLATRLLVTVGPNGDPAAFGPRPSNVTIRRYVPQTIVLPHCSLVVSHAGSGTFLAALDQGLPQLCLPQAADQFTNAAQCAAAGAGLVLMPHEITPDAVRSAAIRILEDPAYADYADLRIMPTSDPGPLRGGVGGLRLSA